MAHRNELRPWQTQGSKMLRAIADLEAANPGLPIGHEPIALDGEQRPWPCVWPGCMTPSLESGTLCAEHEMCYIARSGKRSPVANTIVEWNDRLHARMDWLQPHWTPKEPK